MKITEKELQAFAEKNKKIIESCNIEAHERLNFIQRRMCDLGVIKMIPANKIMRMKKEGVFVAGLSLLRTADILYLTGNFSQKDFNSYAVFEKKKISEIADVTERNIHVKGTPGAVLSVHLSVPVPSFPVIQEVAQRNGYRFNVSKKAIDLAEDIKKTAQMYEWMTSNSRRCKLSSIDGFYETNWDAGYDYEETEQTFLKNIILLMAGLPKKYVSTDLVDTLFSGIFNRLQRNIVYLAGEADAHEEDFVKMIQIFCSTRLFLKAIDHPVALNLMKRKRLLYHAIQEMGHCFEKTYKNNPKWAAYVQKWFNCCTQNFVKNLPQKIKGSQLKDIRFQKGRDELSHE